MSTPSKILDLVVHFKLHLVAWCSADDNEEQARRELLEPRFATLGCIRNSI